MEKVSAAENHPYTPEPWETLQASARRTGYAYQTFKNWKSKRKLPFPIYKNNLVKPEEVDRWVESTKIEPCRPSIERTKICA